MSSNRSADKGVERGGLLLGFLKGGVSSKGPAASKSLDSSPMPRDGSVSGSTEVPVTPEAFAQEASSVLEVWKDLDEKERVLRAPLIASFLTRGIRYHLDDMPACRAACLLAGAVAEGPMNSAKCIFSSGLMMNVLLASKVHATTGRRACMLSSPVATSLILCFPIADTPRRTRPAGGVQQLRSSHGRLHFRSGGADVVKARPRC